LSLAMLGACNTTTLHWAALDGSKVRLLGWLPYSQTVRGADGRGVYFDDDDGLVLRDPKVRSGKSISANDRVGHVATTDTSIYVTVMNGSRGKIVRMALDGSGRRELAELEPNTSVGRFVAANGRLCWNENGNARQAPVVTRCVADQDGIVRTIASRVPSAIDSELGTLVVDRDFVYWWSVPDGLVRTPFAGGPTTRVASDWGERTELDDGWLVSEKGNALVAMRVEGGPRITFARDIGSIYLFVVHAGVAYVMTDDQSKLAVFRVPIIGGATKKLWSGGDDLAPASLAVGQSGVYWTRNNGWD
jgi:hypothetical protein